MKNNIPNHRGKNSNNGAYTKRYCSNVCRCHLVLSLFLAVQSCTWYWTGGRDQPSYRQYILAYQVNGRAEWPYRNSGCNTHYSPRRTTAPAACRHPILSNRFKSLHYRPVFLKGSIERRKWRHSIEAATQESAVRGYVRRFKIIIPFLRGMTRHYVLSMSAPSEYWTPLPQNEI